MKFIYIIDGDNQEVGPLDQSLLERAIAKGEIGRETLVSNAMRRNFREAQEFECFKQAFQNAAPNYVPRKKNVEPVGFWNLVTGNIKPGKKSHAYNRRYTPKDAEIFPRLFAGITDILLIGIVAALLFWIFPHTERSVRGICFFMMAFTLLYYSLNLAIYAQTPGMFLWGIFLARRDMEEAYFLRAFAYSVLLMLFFPLMTVTVALFGRNWPEILTGCRVVYVHGVAQTI